jgi:hypothetical protein
MSRVRGRRSTLLGVGTALGALGLVAACQAIDGIHVYSLDDPEASTVIHDGGTIVTVVTTGFGDADCNLAKPPPAPDPDSVGNFNAGEYVVAFSRLSFTGNGTAVVGYDLDGVCTGEQTEAGTGASSCITADGGPAPEDSTSAAGDGVDAVLTSGSGELQAFFNGLSLDTLTGVQKDIDEGDNTAFLVLDGYNFTANDPQVTVSFATSQRLESIHCEPVDAAVLGFEAAHPAPVFDGCDTWSVDQNTLSYFAEPDGGGKVYAFISDKAYVSNGTLVASFGANLSLPVGTIVLAPSKTILVAPLQLTGADGGPADDAGDPTGDGQIRITNGLIQGRLSVKSFLSSLSVVGDPLQHDAGICPGSPSYPTVQAAACSQLDVAANGPDDHSAACDAFTFASTFDAVTARLGDVSDGGPRSAGCPGAQPSCPFALP